MSKSRPLVKVAPRRRKFESRKPGMAGRVWGMVGHHPRFSERLLRDHLNSRLEARSRRGPAAVVDVFVQLRLPRVGSVAPTPRNKNADNDIKPTVSSFTEAGDPLYRKKSRTKLLIGRHKSGYHGRALSFRTQTLLKRTPKDRRASRRFRCSLSETRLRHSEPASTTTVPR